MSKWNMEVQDVYGKAALKVEGSKAGVKILVKDKDKNEIERRVVVTEFPEYLKTGTWFLRMNMQLTEIKSATPLNGDYTCKFVGFAHRDGEAVAPKNEKAYWADEETKPFFTMLWRVVEGDYAGATITYKVQYDYFIPAMEVINDKPYQVVRVKWFSKKPSKHSKAINGFLDALGLAEKPLQWSDNILPALQKRALDATKNGKLAVIKMEDGYARSISPVGSVLDANEFDLEGFSDPVDQTAMADKGFEETIASPVVEPDPFADDEPSTVDDTDDLPWEDAPADEFPS